MNINNIILTKIKLEEKYRLFHKNEEYVIAVEVIGNAVKEYQKNDDIKNVYLKAILINTLYQTAIMDISRIVNHIHNNSKKIDSKLNIGDISVVDDIRLGHGIKRSKGKQKEMNLYSFSTKYAHFHNPNAYPIYDNYVTRLLSNANKKMGLIQKGFHERFIQSQLQEYSFYKSVIDSLARELGIVDWGYKKIDEGLWMYAKELYDNKG